MGVIANLVARQQVNRLGMWNGVDRKTISN